MLNVEMEYYAIIDLAFYVLYPEFDTYLNFGKNVALK